eukprot:TRINITY_DN551_c0_g3_i1.p1 TRINITY_DN551_c0_g3~~TRINITY_DN551_c0_g3_i1.p1  ORF type:complete len:112 (-),score=7.86 TRINITY_DN551_c0_g3_i1:54-389(-)
MKKPPNNQSMDQTSRFMAGKKFAIRYQNDWQTELSNLPHAALVRELLVHLCNFPEELTNAVALDTEEAWDDLHKVALESPEMRKRVMNQRIHPQKITESTFEYTMVDTALM